MKKPTAFLLLLLATASMLFAQDHLEKPVLTVMNFETSGISEQEVRIFVDFVSFHIHKTRAFVLIDRMQRESLLKEIEFSKADCTDEGCQIEIGKLLSASLIIAGSIGKVGSWYIVNMKLIDVQTGKTVESASKRYPNIDALIDDSEELTDRLTGRDQVIATAQEESDTTGSVDGSRIESGTDQTLGKEAQRAETEDAEDAAEKGTLIVVAERREAAPPSVRDAAKNDDTTMTAEMAEYNIGESKVSLGLGLAVGYYYRVQASVIGGIGEVIVAFTDHFNLSARAVVGLALRHTQLYLNICAVPELLLGKDVGHQAFCIGAAIGVSNANSGALAIEIAPRLAMRFEQLSLRIYWSASPGGASLEASYAIPLRGRS